MLPFITLVMFKRNPNIKLSVMSVDRCQLSVAKNKKRQLIKLYMNDSLQVYA